jgi:hypothetical protein
MLCIDDYPQLTIIAWNRPGERMIGERDAFGLYERNWRYVDVQALDDTERELIRRLNRQFGHGVVLNV